MNMKVSLTRIKNENTVTSTQVVTKDGALRFVRISIIHKQAE